MNLTLHVFVQINVNLQTLFKLDSKFVFCSQCSVAVEMRAGSNMGPGYEHHGITK